LAVIGFDNQPIAEHFQITTMDTHLLTMGRTVFRQLYDQITEMKRATPGVEIQYNLVVRSSV
jgi:LacI family purine nucleotide synthesis repressor